MRTKDTDVVVIGTGFGGAAPSLRLARAGWRVTVLEKGLPPEFRQTQDPKHLLRYLRGVGGDHLSLTYAEALGGGSGFYEMVSLRAPSAAFRQTDAGGTALWPAGITRDTLDPYYDVAEEMLRVEQIRPEEVPKSGLVFALLMKNLGYSCDRARYAVRGCVGSGFCVTGCVYGAKQWLARNYLPEAGEAGADILTGLEALEVGPLGAAAPTPVAGPLTRVPFRWAVLARETGARGELRRFRARLVILAGGTVGTASLLLRSRRHLPRLSPQTGRNIAFNGSVKVAGLLPDGFPDGDMFTGRSHPGMVSYEFLASHGIMITCGKPLPLQAVASARLRLDGDGREPSFWGAPHVELMKRYRRRVIVLVAFGLTPPGGTLRARGTGTLDLSLPLTDELRGYHHRTEELLRSLILRNGGRIVDAEFVDSRGTPREDLHFSTAHQVGSCRMADSPERGVVDAGGEVFGHPGLYVSDGAAIPSSLAVNTSLTILANAERIAQGILARHAPAAGAAAAGGVRR